jgi:hypothetical protein
MLVLIYLSLPFLIVAGILFLLARRASGWDAMGYGIGAGIALAGLGVVILGFLVFLVIRDGLVASNILPFVILAAVLGAAAWWGWGAWSEHRACERDRDFFGAYGESDMAERAAMLTAHPGRAAAIGQCGEEMLDLRIGVSPYLPRDEDAEPEETRLAAWRLLLDHGLPADERRLYGAVNHADAGLVALLVEKRLADGAPEPVPADLAAWTIGKIDMDPESPYHPQAAAYLAMLETYLAAGLDLCATGTGTRSLADLMEMRAVPRTLWESAADCGP